MVLDKMQLVELGQLVRKARIVPSVQGVVEVLNDELDLSNF